MSTTPWIKSVKSGQSGQCVEMRRCDGQIQIQDSKAPELGMLTMPGDSFRAFLSAARQGEFDQFA